MTFISHTISLLHSLSLCAAIQLAAQVLDDLDDEDIGFGLVDEKKDSAVAKKLGEPVTDRDRTCSHIAYRLLTVTALNACLAQCTASLSTKAHHFSHSHSLCFHCH